MKTEREMSKLLTATALSLAMPFSAMAAEAVFPTIVIQGGQTYRASELIGTRIYAADTEMDAGMTAPAGASADWDDIGEINDVVLSMDGQVRAVIIGVGGFLGIGERDVAISLDSLAAIVEDDDPDVVFLVVNATKEQIEAAPEVMNEDDAMAANATAPMEQNAPAVDDGVIDVERPMLTSPAYEVEGYETMPAGDLTAEELSGARVYGAGDEDVGEVDELILSDDGSIQQVVLDVGGFLGMGEHHVAVTMDELQIMRGEGDDVRVYIEATQEQLEAQPEYEGD
jgi:hypothetical protein